MRINKTKFELSMARKGLTATRLCELSGVSRQSISTIRYRGSCAPQTAARLAAGLGIDISELIQEEGQA